MGTTQGSDSGDPERGHTIPCIYFRQPVFTGSSKLPFFLPEAMVNHKKMVHPPSCG